MSTLIKKITVKDFLSFGHNENLSYIEYNEDERFLSVIGNNDTGKTNITRYLVNFLNSLWNEQKIIFDSRKYKSEYMSVITILYSIENCGDFEYQIKIDNSDKDYNSHYIKEEILKFNESEFIRKTDNEDKSVIEFNGSVIDVNLSKRDSILNINTPEVSLKTGMEYLKNSMIVIKLNQRVLSKEVVDFIKHKDNFNIRESICFDKIKDFIKDMTSSEDLKDISVTDDSDLYFSHDHNGKIVEIQESSLSIKNIIEILFRFFYYKDKLLVVDGIEEHIHPLALRFLLHELLFFTKTNNLQGLVVCRSSEIFNLYKPGNHNKNYIERLNRIIVCGKSDTSDYSFVFNLGSNTNNYLNYDEFNKIIEYYNNGELASHYFNL